MKLLVPKSWEKHLESVINSDGFKELSNFLEQEFKQQKAIYPEFKNIFRALELVPLEKVSVVVLGQDPYHQPGQAHGLAFSVPDGTPLPPSLKNIFKELDSEFGPQVRSGNLERWTQQGVLLLNTVMTVEHGQAHSHANRGWEKFTDAVIQTIQEKNSHCVFILWGSHAQAKTAIINTNKHLVLTSAHPSPLSAYRGFFGNQHFTKTNSYLDENGKKIITW
jgi:uracil-DNA glycosylase